MEHRRESEKASVEKLPLEKTPEYFRSIQLYNNEYASIIDIYFYEYFL